MAFLCAHFSILRVLSGSRWLLFGGYPSTQHKRHFVDEAPCVVEQIESFRSERLRKGEDGIMACALNTHFQCSGPEGWHFQHPPANLVPGKCRQVSEVKDQWMPEGDWLFEEGIGLEKFEDLVGAQPAGA